MGKNAQRRMLWFLRQVLGRTSMGWLSGGLLATIGSQALLVCQPLALGKLLSIFAHSLGTDQSWPTLAGALGAFVLLWFGVATLQALAGFCNAVVMQDLRVAGKRVAFTLLLGKGDRTFFTSTHAGGLEVLVTTASMCCRGVYQEFATSLLRFLALTIFASIALGLYDHRLSVVFAVWVVCFIGMSANSRFNRAPALAGVAVGATFAVGAFMVDVLKNIGLVQAVGEEANECQKLDVLLHEERRLYLRGQLEVERALIARRTLLFLLVAVVALVVGVDAKSGRIAPAGVGVVMVIALMLAYQFDTFGQSAIALQEYVCRLDRSLSGLAICADHIGNEAMSVTSSLQRRNGIFPIECRDVAFGYAGQPPLFTGVNLNIEAGDRIGIKGPSGAGKSTLLDLLRGESTPARGVVLSAGHDLRRLPTEHFRASVAYVSQDTPILHRSLRENLLYGVHRRVDDGALIDLLRRLGLDRLQGAGSVDLGLCVGEQGTRLSGGERQRVGLIRALLRDVRLILLDEPTSALDSVNEQLVARFIESLPPDRAVVVVSHRPELLQSLDRIYVVDQGCIRPLVGSGGQAVATPGRGGVAGAPGIKDPPPAETATEGKPTSMVSPGITGPTQKSLTASGEDQGTARRWAL